MDAESNVSRPELFAWAVRKRHIPVESAVGLYVVHRQFGQGHILAVDRSQSGYVVQIRFHDMPSNTGTKKFLSHALWPGPITDMQLPRVLDTDARLRAALVAEIRTEHKIMSAARDAEPMPATQQHETAPKRNTQPADFVEKRTQVILAQHLDERRQKEATYAWLVSHYLGRAGVVASPFNPHLDIVLRRLHAARPLERAEIGDIDRILRALGRRHPAVTATCYELLAVRCGYRGYLARACSYWRQAEQPEKVLEIAVTREDDSTTLQAAFLTTRAAALADMERWAEAKQLGARAAGSAPGGGHAYNVLGRIDHETGAHDRAGCYFAVAQGRAKPVPTDPDAALRARVTEMAPAARVSIARYLLGRDSERFRWVRPYLQETGSEENPQ